MVAFQNKKKYGEYILTEFQQPDFVSAYGALSRVDPPFFIKRVPLSFAAMSEISGKSKYFSQIAPFLNGEEGQSWAEITNYSDPLENNEKEIGGGWFVFALRSSVEASGYYKNLASSTKYYSELSNEINTDCDKGILKCKNKRNTLFPVWRKEYVGDAAKQVGILLSKTFSIDSTPTLENSSNILGVSTESINLAENITGEREFDSNVNDIRYKFINIVTSVYRFILLPLFISGAIFLVRSIFQKKLSSVLDFRIVTSSVLLIGILSLSFIVISLGTLSFSTAIAPAYFAPIVPLLISFILVANMDSFDS